MRPYCRHSGRQRLAPVPRPFPAICSGMARPPLPPILLGEARKARFVLSFRCPICKHSAEMPAMEMPLPHDLTLSAVGHRMRCTECSRRGGIDIVPDGAAWVRYLRVTGQRDRWPWYAGLIRDEPADLAADALSAAKERP